MRTAPEQSVAARGRHGAAFSCWWSNRYTRGLPTDARERRRTEIAGDVHEHILVATHDGTRSPGVAIAWRTVRGMPNDLIWRRQEQQAMRHTDPHSNGSRLHAAWAVVTQSWFAPLALLLGVFNLLASLAVLREEDGKMPGQAIGPVLMSLLALAVFTGLWLRWRAGRALEARGPDPQLEPLPVSRRQLVLLAVALSVSLVLFAIGASTNTIAVFFVAMAMIAVTALAVGVRIVGRALRSSGFVEKAGLADALIIIGALPALALFWMVIPPILALLVIGGVVGTNPRLRTA